MTCSYCSLKDEEVLYVGTTCSIVVPSKQHISPHDGGHLIALPNRHVEERSRLRPVEMLEIDYLSIVASFSLQRLLNTDWFNFQENGNWSLDEPEEQHMHMHVYGRKVGSIQQIYGEALSLPLQEDFENWHVEQFSSDQIDQLGSIVRDILDSNWTKPYKAALKGLLQQST